MENHVDLFGEIPVTVREIELWLFKVPKMPHFHRYRAGYARAWRVADKIRRAKADGTLAAWLDDECCGYCGQVLAPLPDPPSAPPAAELDALRRRLAVLELIIGPTKNPRLAGLMI